MEIFTTLEKRVARLIEVHTELKDRVAELERENETLRKSAGDADVAALRSRIADLESERTEIRTRLERLLAQVETLDI